MKNYDVSIIVPIYNVEKFIEKCTITLMEQDYQNIEYIFVNDCTPDNSMQVLSDTLTKYPNRKDDIKIINKSKNEGLGQARKTGVENANGEYILHIDSDDWVELNMVSSMLKKAKETNADIVCCDYYINYKNKQVYKSHNYINDKSNMIIFLLSGYSSPTLYDKIIKKDLYEKVEFPKFSYGEDLYTCLQVFYYAKNIQYLRKILYHYNKVNENSITSNKENLHKNLSQAYELNIKIQDFLKEKSIFKQYITYHYQRMLLIAICNISDITPFKDNILKICPQANKIKYILSNKNLSLIKKIMYSILFLNINILNIYMKNIAIYIKKIN